MDPTALRGPDRDFLDWLAALDGEDPLETLRRLMELPPTRPTDPALAGAVSTAVRDGRFTSLGLGPVAGTLLGHHDALAERLPTLDALEHLECAGLGLTRLDLARLAGVRTLDVTDNQLTELDVGGLRGLRWLGVDGNRLMVLDVRSAWDLEALRCAGNELSALVLPQPSRLRVLRCERNQLITLDLGAQPVLEELGCYRNGLHALWLRSAPRLRHLDCARNELSSLDLPGLPCLEELLVTRNRLASLSLPPAPRLKLLACRGNYLGALDVAAHQELVELRCGANQLSRLDLAGQAHLELLDCRENRLRELTLQGCVSLVELDCAGNELAALDLRATPAACAVDCTANELTALDPSACPGLARLACAENALRTLDVTANHELWSLESTRGRGGPRVLATDLQRHRLAELRARDHLGSGGQRVEGLDPWELHDFARQRVERGAESELLEVVQSPACDLGTALMIYWSSGPHYYLQYAAREEVEPWELAGWDLLRTVERLVRDGAFRSRLVPFDPRNDKETRSVRGHDWTRGESLVHRPARTEIPAWMFTTTAAHPGG